MRPKDLMLVVSHLPRDIRDLMDTNPKMCVAGGFIRSVLAREEPSDIDMFGSSKETIQTVAVRLKAARERQYPTTKMHNTDNAITIVSPGRVPVQFITRWVFLHPKEVLPSFDYTIAQAVVWKEGGAWIGEVGADFYADLASKRLVYTSPNRDEDPGGSAMRMRKFIAKGYYISPEDMAKVIDRLCTGMVEDEEKAKAEGKVMKPRWRRIAFRLREVDPLRVIDGLDVIEEHV